MSYQYGSSRGAMTSQARAQYQQALDEIQRRDTTIVNLHDQVAQLENRLVVAEQIITDLHRQAEAERTRMARLLESGDREPKHVIQERHLALQEAWKPRRVA